MNCWRHSLSVCCGNQAARVFLLKGYWSDGERRREDQMIAYCDACAEEMTKSWSYPGWMLDWPSRVGSALEWEELPHEAIDMLEVQQS
jgi:hypothetical protein